MKFTPFSIKAQEFAKSMRGYDTDEVRVFLESLANEFDTLQKENEKLLTEIETNAEEITEYKKLEKSLQSTLLNAQESTSKSVESAKKQNQLIIKEAEIKANQIIEKAKLEADLIRSSVLRLKEERNLFIAKLKSMVETQSSILDMGVDSIDSKNPVIESNLEPNQSKIDEDDVLERLL
ncbi:MAG: DivIVA domain-containing protein [Melioribacteraceae bacterium]|nr:DivIVA domain-containing protein [Melioribacteraceae bacterium]